MRLIKLYSILVLLFISGFSQAQEFSIKYVYAYKVVKKLSISVEPRLVLENGNNFSLKAAHLSANCKYKIAKPLLIHVGARNSYYSSELQFFEDDKQRIYGGVTYDLPFSNKRYDFSYRYRIQSTFKEQEQTIYHRNCFEIKFKDYSKIQPYVSVEIYANKGLNEFIKNDIELGLTYKNEKELELKGYFSIQSKIENTLPQSYYSLGIILKNK